MNQATALKAAKWWADKLRGPAQFDNGDKSDTGAMTMMLSIMLGEKSRQGGDPDKFEAALAEILQKQTGERFNVGVDYWPDSELADAASAAGFKINIGTFPCKTMMWINGNEIKVACGYQAPIEVLK